MPKHQIFGLIGSALLMLGVFMPIIQVPIIGGMNYVHDGRGDGIIILILALASIGLLFTPAYRGLIATGLLSLAVMLYTLINFFNLKSDMRNGIEGDDLGIAKGLSEAIRLDFGWGFLFLGVVMVIVGGFLPNELKKSKKRRRTRTSRTKSPKFNPANDAAADALDELGNW